MIPTSLLRRVISQSPDVSLSPAIESLKLGCHPASESFLAVQRPPQVLCHNMPTTLVSNGKAGFSENNPDGVTILQWFTGFDAALGFHLFLAPRDYSRELHSRQAVA
jgi:hypothetical protein